MAGYKVLLLAVLVVFGSFHAYGLRIDIDIGEVASHGAYDVSYSEEVSELQEINTTVENLGSIGCSYRLKAVLDGKNLSETEYSRAHELWPGETALMTVRHLPLNYTGRINTDIYVTYCDQEKLVERFNYTQKSKVLGNRSFEAETLESGEDGATIKVEKVESGYLVPEEVPPGWKVSSTSIEEGKAELHYQAPIFDERRNMTYKVVSPEGEFMGTTGFSLETEEGLLEVVNQNIWKLLFAALLAANIVLVSTGKLRF